MSQSVEGSRSERLRADADAVWPHIRQALRDLGYGHVTIIVQDGHVVQIERMEKRRFTNVAKQGGLGADGLPPLEKNSSGGPAEAEDPSG